MKNTNDKNIFNFVERGLFKGGLGKGLYGNNRISLARVKLKLLDT